MLGLTPTRIAFYDPGAEAQRTPRRRASIPRPGPIHPHSVEHRNRRQRGVLLWHANDPGVPSPSNYRKVNSMTPDQLVYTVPEAAKLLRISPAHAYALVSRGELPSLRLGRRILIPRCALE